jgi:hypothetical protein
MMEVDMTTTVNDALAHTSPWALEENFWLEGPAFYRAHMAEDAAMWFPGRPEPVKGKQILDGLRNAPRWESVVFDRQEIEVADDRVTLRYRATARRDGQDDYTAECITTYEHDPGGLRLVEHRQRAV